MEDPNRTAALNSPKTKDEKKVMLQLWCHILKVNAQKSKSDVSSIYDMKTEVNRLQPDQKWFKDLITCTSDTSSMDSQGEIYEQSPD